MKKITRVLALVMALVMVLAIAGCSKKTNTGVNTDTQSSSNSGTTNNSSTDTGSKTPDNGGSTTTTPVETQYEYNITVWCPEKEVPLRKQQIEDFNNTNTDGIKFNASVEAVSEADAATQMITDVEAGADLYNFAQDQIARLIVAGALLKLDDEAASFVKSSNDEGAVAAVTSGDALYGFPITSDNGYFLFYDKSVVSEEQAKTVQGVIDACKAAGRTFAAPLKNGWYVAGWFFGTGCDSTWTAD